MLCLPCNMSDLCALANICRYKRQPCVQLNDQYTHTWEYSKGSMISPRQVYGCFVHINCQKITKWQLSSSSFLILVKRNLPWD